MAGVTLITIIALCLYPVAKRGLQEVMIDIAQIIAAIINLIIKTQKQWVKKRKS